MLNRVLDFLPKNLRGNVVRDGLRIDYMKTNDFIIKVADCEEELEGAFRVLHDCYVEKNYIQARADGKRTTPYHILPTTTTFVIKVGKRVIGTMSVIKDGPLGVPSDTLFDLSFLRDQNFQLAEISSLAIHPEYRQAGGRALFSLMKFMWHYVKDYMCLDAIVVSVNPTQKLLYDEILFFDEIKLQEKTYSFVNGNQAIGRYALVKNLRDHFQKAYAHKCLSKNLYHFFFEYEDPHLQFPARPFFKVIDPILSSEQIQSLFLKDKDLFNKIPIEKKIRCLIYFKNTSMHGVVRELLKVEGDIIFFTSRRHPRFEALLEGQTLTVDRDMIRVKSVSREGILIESSNLTFPKKIRVSVAPGLWSQLEIDPVSSQMVNQTHWRARIQKADKIWWAYIDYLENDFNKRAPLNSKAS